MLASAVVIAAMAAAVLSFHLGPAASRMHAARRATYLARGAMLNQESGLRGYMATHDDAYLEPATQGATELAQANADLDRTIGTDAPLAPLLLDTRVAEARWTSDWAVAARTRDSIGDVAFLARGKRLFDEYRVAQRSLNAGIEERVVSINRVMRAVRVSTLLFQLGLLATVVLFAARERQSRDKHEERLAVLFQGARETAESLDERHIVRAIERTAAVLAPGTQAEVVLARDDAPPTPKRDDATTIGTVPMMVGGRVVGALVAKATRALRAPEPHAAELLEALANYGAAAIESARLYRFAQEQSRVDALTRVFNRRRLDEDLADECRRSARYRRPLSLLMVDVDHFKAYNDANGHAAGDKALQEVAALLRAGVRLIDSVYRFGGEELVLLLRETDAHGAGIVAERLRKNIEAAGKVTASFGVAELDPARPVASVLIDAADRSLYVAKRAGRNRVSSAQQSEEQPRLDA